VVELLERGLEVLAGARESERVEIVLARTRERSAVAFEGELEELTQAETVAVGVRVLVASRTGMATASSLELAALRSALERARENAALVEADPDAVLAEPDGVPSVALELVDGDVLCSGVEERIRAALELERRARGIDPRVRQIERASAGDLASEVAIASTTGIATQVASTRAWLALQVVASDGGPDANGFASMAARGPAALELDAVAAEAVARALRGLGATKPTTQGVAVVFEPRCAASILALWGQAASGLAVARRRSMFADRVGERITPAWFGLIDDPTAASSLGASPVDGEGLATRPNTIIADGVLHELLYDAYAARLAQRRSNGAAVRGVGSLPAPGARALRVLAPRTPVERLVAKDTVLAVHSLSGLHSGTSSVSGAFSVGVEGVLWRDGQPIAAVREATVAGNLLAMARDLVAVGDDDRELPSGTRAASLLVDGLMLAGS